jgi:UDP-N-acetylmuramate--alanine ligase
MNPPRWALESDRALGIVRAGLSRPRSPFLELPPRLVLVDVALQRLSLIERSRVATSFPVSTASAGVGGEDGSGRTPAGWHRIHSRIGAGAPFGAVFVSREPTGEIWRGEPREEDLILTRVLRLDGLEESVNHGPGCDSLARYIYIHGSNHEEDLGRPASHGCVRMASADVVELFDRVREGDPVLIMDEAPNEPA